MNKTTTIELARCAALGLLLSSGARADEGPVDDDDDIAVSVVVADEAATDAVRGFAVEAIDIDEDAARDRYSRERAPAIATRAVDLPAPEEALRTLRRSIEPLIGDAARSDGDKLVATLDALDLVEGGAPFPEVLCLGRRGLSAFLDDSAAHARDPDGSDAAATTLALADVCGQLAGYGFKGAAPQDPWREPDGGSTTPVIEFNEALCAKPRVVVAGVAGDAELFKLDGYKLDDVTITLEEGQRLGAVGCKAHEEVVNGGPFTTTVDYGLQFVLTHLGKTDTLPFVAVGDDGVALPSGWLVPDQLGATHGSLSFQTVRRSCSFGSCTLSPLGSETKAPLDVVSRGALCTLTYEFNQFAINDRADVAPKEEWRSTRITGAIGTGVAPSHQLRAIARTITAAGAPLVATSSFPAFADIVDGTSFAVHADDAPISIYERQVPRQQYIDQMGTVELSALRFPRVINTVKKAGATVTSSYSCRPPSLVRDFVAFCSASSDTGPTDSMYLLPYHGTPQLYAGNNAWSAFGAQHTTFPEFYAYDFITNTLDDVAVYAARAGVVVEVIDSHDGGTGVGVGTCVTDGPGGTEVPTPSCPNNKIIVQHQDGTTAQYLHIAHHESFVTPGQRVMRGEKIANSGSVGQSGKRHIHFDVHQSRLAADLSPGMREQRLEDLVDVDEDGVFEPEDTSVVFSPVAPTRFSIPSSFDRWDAACEVPGTNQWPTSTLSAGFPADAGGPVYTTLVSNPSNLPMKRSIAQSPAPPVTFQTPGVIHTQDSTVSRVFTMFSLQSLPPPLTVTWSSQGVSKVQVGTAKQHAFSASLTFKPAAGFSNNAVHVHVVDVNSNVHDFTLPVTIYMNPDYDFKACENKPWTPGCGPMP